MAVVIGITGCTRCGKGRVAAALSEKLGGVEIVGQDNFWLGPRPDPSGQMSDEEPACTCDPTKDVYGYFVTLPNPTCPRHRPNVPKAQQKKRRRST